MSLLRLLFKPEIRKVKIASGQECKGYLLFTGNILQCKCSFFIGIGIFRINDVSHPSFTAKRSLIKLPVLTKRNPVLILVANRTLSPPPQMLSEFLFVAAATASATTTALFLTTHTAVNSSCYNSHQQQSDYDIPNVHTFLSFHDNLHAHTQMPFPSNESGDV